MRKGYDKIDFIPPKKVQRNAERGLQLRKQFGRGGLTSIVAGKLGIGSGIVRATNLSSGKQVSPKTIKRMSAYFSRHRNDRRPGWNNPKNPSNGYIAWLLWGGDEGKDWANRIIKQMKKADSKK